MRYEIKRNDLRRLPQSCGHYFGFEVKRPYIGVISPIQQDSINRITKAGGTAAVVSYADEALEIIRRTLN